VTAADSVAPLLMFAEDAEAAMRFYVSVFYPARIEQLERHGDGDPGPAGTVKHAVLRIGDRVVHCIDGGSGHAFTFTPAVSLAVRCASVRAVDGAFARLADGGTVLMPVDRYPFSERFGWVTDRFGVSWQISLA
jgi:predicted 3-demethylubiquinone-9 3-methyltransferase (glyoxalase superfamily)